VGVAPAEGPAKRPACAADLSELTIIDSLKGMQNSYADVASFVTRYYSAAPGSVTLRVVPFRSGLESVQVAYVHSEYRDPHQHPRRADFVVKLATGQAAREASAYRLLLSGYTGALAPRLLGVDWPGQDTVRIYLEWIRPWRAWPWRDLRLLARTMDLVAEAHTSLSDCWFRAPTDLSCWDYEQELAASTLSTIELFERESARGDMRPLRRAIPGLHRLAAGLPALRRQIKASDHGIAVLHGDIHSGNVVVRARGNRREPFLLDWGRTRLGSPLEDVSSWLQSIRCWEPEAKRRHDTLLQRYLGARGFSTRLSACVREAYWIAAAFNGLAGAIRYHLVTFSSCRSRKPRISALVALHDWLRIIRRADAASRVQAGPLS
jgi:hypothetical protein